MAVFATRDTQAPTQYDGGEHDQAMGATAYLAIADAHVIGLLVTRLCEQRIPFAWTPNDDGTLPAVDPDIPEFRQPCCPTGPAVRLPSGACGLEYVWVHPRRRNAGIATRLINAFTVRTGVTTSETAWRQPFASDAGAALARRHGPGTFWGY